MADPNPTYDKLQLLLAQRLQVILERRGFGFEQEIASEARSLLDTIWPEIEKIEKEYVRWRMVSDPFFNPSADRLANE